MTKHCPYCDAVASKSVGWYFDCENGHTFHLDDWGTSALNEGWTV